MTITNMSKELEKIAKQLAKLHKQNEEMATRRITVQRMVVETIDRAIHEFEREEQKAGYPFQITNELREARKQIV